VAGRTESEFPRKDATPAELRTLLLRIADELRLLGVGNQADRIERIVGLLEAPALRGELRQIGHPRTFLTPDGARWLAEQVMAAAGLIAELMADAEITGSDRVMERAREWLESMDLQVDDVE
jgi:hypothetical protein